MFFQKHLLGIEKLTFQEINLILDLAEKYAVQNRQKTCSEKQPLCNCTQVNMFFENSTRTQASFEIAGRRLGANVMNINTELSSINKGETLLDTAVNLNAMRPDLIVVRHPHSGAVQLLSEKATNVCLVVYSLKRPVASLASHASAELSSLVRLEGALLRCQHGAQT